MSDLDMPPHGTWEQRGGWVVRRLQKDMGLTIEQAAGIVGNLGLESAGFTTLHELGQPEGRGGYGWAQWTADRRVTFFEWCKEHNLAWTSDEANYGYLLAELRDTQAKSLQQLKKTTTVEAAVFTFGYWFERPGGTTKDHLPGYEGRLKYAQRALAGAKIAAPDVMPTAISPWDKIKAIQLVLGVKQDGDFGPLSRRALNKILRAANQPGVRKDRVKRVARLAGLVLLGISLAGAVQAHDGSGSLATWYRSLIAADGTSCCNTQDCGPVEARLTNGEWQVMGPRGWEIVPPEAVLRRENQDGRPIGCRPGGRLHCFIPPAGA